MFFLVHFAAAYLSSSPFFLSIICTSSEVMGPKGSCPGTRMCSSSLNGCPVLTKASASLRLRLATKMSREYRGVYFNYYKVYNSSW